MKGYNLFSGRFKMRAGRAAGNETSAFRVSMCSGTWLPQSCVSPRGVLGHYRAPNRCVPNPEKVWLFRWKIPVLLSGSRRGRWSLPVSRRRTPGRSLSQVCLQAARRRSGTAARPGCQWHTEHSHVTPGHSSGRPAAASWPSLNSCSAAGGAPEWGNITQLTYFSTYRSYQWGPRA